MCYFIPYFMQYFSHCKIKKYIYLLFLPRFAYFLVLLLGFHLLITFLRFRCLFFKRLFYYNIFVILNDTIKLLDFDTFMVISQSSCPTFNLNYMLCQYLQMFSDKINKCESQIFTNVRILLFKKFFIGHSSFYKL